MRTLVVGAGPVGLLCAVALARAGNEVMLVDRDSGPQSTDSWERRGVMQFEHPHFFRHIVVQVLAELAPDVLQALHTAGALPATVPGMPPELVGLQCRRSVFERVLRHAVQAEPAVDMRVGHADAPAVHRGKVSGVIVDGAFIEADRVLCATGRASHFADDVRAPGTDLDCGFAYVSRMYRARPSATWPDFPVLGATYDGYIAILFPHDNRIVSALVIRRSSDRGLMALRHNRTYEAAVAAIPNLAPWTAPGEWEPLGDVMVGGRLSNGYRGQLDPTGAVPIPGLLFLGDAVCTTNPSGGRGVSLGFAQAAAALSLFAEHNDPADATAALDAWSQANIFPWYLDHVERDAAIVRRFAGEPLDLDGPLTADVIVDAAQHEPSLMSAVGPYLGMLQPPSSLAAAEQATRNLLRSGWRPPYAAGPTRDELADIVRTAVPVHA
ncbi:MAG: FAD-dependent monooxygenase [Mycobacteriales bacterium]